MLETINIENATCKIIFAAQNMLEIIWKILFFLLMLVVVANVTSTSIVIVIVLGYVLCVFSYYCFNNFRETIEKIEGWFNHLHANITFNDTMASNPSAGYIINNRKYSKINPNGVVPSVGGKKVYQPLSNLENTFPKESILESGGSSIIKMDYKNGELLSPIMKSNSPLRSNRTNRDKLKVNLSPKIDLSSRKNLAQMCGPWGQVRRYNHSNMDLETFMNVNSPGFTSRVVDKAAESASYHVKYPAVRQISNYRFDKSTLRHFSKVPRASSSSIVRIAPPEPSNQSLFHDDIVVENTREDTRKDPFVHVLGDSSRKRNYSQEETDRIGGTPKKSRKSEVKNNTSQYKRAHEDCSNDSIDDKSRKKRCDDADRNYAKMMSYTSSMSVLAPDFCWNSQSKKRKSSKLEKSKNESPEKLEKCRKICEESLDKSKDVSIRTTEHTAKVCSTQTVDDISQMDDVKSNTNMDETDGYNTDIGPPSFDDDVEYIRVAGGKILNRTNCTYRKRLKNIRIDPQSVVTAEPEYYSDTSYIDDRTKKEKLLSDLVNDIEGKGEKTDSVIFYQNSIVEEIEKNVATVEVHQPKTSIITSSIINPLMPPTAKLTPGLESNVSVSPATRAVNTNALLLESALTTTQSLDLPVNMSKTDVTSSSTSSSLLKNQGLAPATKSAFTIKFDVPVTSAVSENITINPSPSSNTIVTAKMNVSELNNLESNASQVFGNSPKTNTVETKIPEPVLTSEVVFGDGMTTKKPDSVDNSTLIGFTSPSFSLANTSLNDTAATTAINKNPLIQTPQFSFGDGSSLTPVTKTFTDAISTQSVFEGTNKLKLSFDTKPASTTQSVFSVIPTTQSTSTTKNSTFGVATTVTFGSSTAPVFGNITSTSSAFGTNSPALSNFENTTITPSTFGSNSAVNSLFGNVSTNSQPVSTSQPEFANVSTSSESIFGNVKIAGQSVFGNSPVKSTSVFDISTATPAPTFGTTPPPSAFGTTSAQSSFGMNPATSRASVQSFGSNSSVQSVFGSNSATTQNGSVFGNTTSSTQSSTFGSGTSTPTDTGFGNRATITQQSTFDVNAPTFNFGSGSSSLGAGNSFGTAGNASTGGFSFGSGSNTAGPPTGPTFQFGTANQPVAAASPSQTFVFGGGVPSTTQSAGGFSIGSGGSNSSRARAVARSRKK